MYKENILNEVGRYYNATFGEDKFIPGETLIPFAGRVFDHEELKYLVESSLDFWLTAGRFSDEFEKDFAVFMEQKYCHLVNSGSSANLLALTALTSSKLYDRRLQKGDEVISVAAGFPTTVAPIIQNGLIPVFVDVEMGTYNIDPDKIEAAISSKTKAVMLAHTLGNPFNLEVVMGLAEKYKLYVIEDCCDAVGTTYQGKKAGSFGDISTVSFYPAHHMTMGEGGAVLTNSDKLSRILLSFRDWGRDCYCPPGQDDTCKVRFLRKYDDLPDGYDHKYVYSHLGYNLKLTDMQAAVGVAQFKKLPLFIEKRKENFRKLRKGLEKYQDFLLLPHATPNANPSWFAFPITVKEKAPFSKHQLTGFLEKKRILTRQLFAGNMTKQPAFKGVEYRISGDLSNTDMVMNGTFFIGVYPGIDEQRMDYMISVFEQFFNEMI